MIWTTQPAAVPTALLVDYEALLTDEERGRSRAFVDELHRREFLVTRALARTTLSRYRPLPPRAWCFRRNAYGRPEIDPPCGLHFNLANHPTLVVCAISTDTEIGVDVEPIARGVDIVALSDSVFAPQERIDLRALDGVARADRAVSLWTLKEAYIKARGMGLSLPLTKFAFCFEDERAPTISFAPPIVDRAERWSFSLHDVEGHRIALATVGMPSIRVERCIPLSER